MCPNAKYTDYAVRTGVIITFQILDSQASSFHRTPFVYFLKADFSIFGRCFMNVVNGYKTEKYPNIEGSKYRCHEPKGSLHTLEESTLQRQWLGVKKE